MSAKRQPRRETWGSYRRQDGTVVTMIRGPRNRTWFEDANGERVGPEQSNICPAHWYVGWKLIGGIGG